MKSRLLRLFFMPAVLLLACSAAEPRLPGSSAVAQSRKWDEAINRLTANDATHPPAAGGIVFVGSSSIVKWSTLAADFPEYQVLNRGFGGSRLPDSVTYADRIVLPYRPRAVVVYAGENDIAAGVSPQSVHAAFKAFLAKVQPALPDTRIIYIGMKPSPSRWRWRAQLQEGNALIRAECAHARNCTFVDVWSRMLDARGGPRPDLFTKDMLHMNAAGYAIWRDLLQPVLRQKQG